MRTFIRFLVRMSFLIIFVTFGLACSSAYIPVQNIGFPHMLSLFMMTLLALAAMITIITLFMKMRVLGIIGILVLLFTSSIWNRQFGYHFFAKEKVDDLTVFTYNTQRFVTMDSVDTFESFTTWLEGQKKVDVFVFQELKKNQALEIAKLLEDYEHTINYSKKSHPQTFLFSKYPIESVNQDLDGYDSRVYEVVLDVDGEKIKVIPCHMLSNAVTMATDELFQEIKDNKIKVIPRHFRKIVRSYFTRSKERMDIWYKIKKHITMSMEPVIMLGDFNDTPYSPLYTDASKVLDDSFQQSGAGLARTFRIPYPSIKIDHIFVSDKLHCNDIKIINLPFSDHNGIWASVQIQEK